MGQAAELLGVSVDKLRRWADDDRLATERTPGGHRIIDGVELARFASELAEADQDEDPGGSRSIASVSARNRFLGLVTRVVRNDVMAQVEIQAGPHRLVSLVSAEAVDDLGLEPGVLASAMVKSTNVVVERPATRR